jgi:hypothetical protein
MMPTRFMRGESYAVAGEDRSGALRLRSSADLT